MELTANEVEKLPGVVQRIQALFAHYGLNASSATRALGYNTTSKLYKILEGSEPSFPTLVDFLTKWPDVSADWLVLGKGPMLRSETGGAVAAGTLPMLRTARKANALPALGSPDRVLVATVDSEGKGNTSFVPIPVQAGYVRQHNEPVFFQQLRHYDLPGFESGTFRAFEVAGDSMEPTLNHRDIVIASLVDNWRVLEPGAVYVVVTSESVMLKRIQHRITDEAQPVVLHSDNAYLKPYSLDTADILELWRVRGYLSTYIPSAPDVTVERLWEVIETLGFDRGEVRRHLDENAPNSAPNI